MSMTNQETDTALILEGELKRRVREVASDIIREAVAEAIKQEMAKNKHDMLMEVSIKVGQMLRGIEKDGRQPLWVSGPETMNQFGLSVDSLTTSEGELSKELDHAIR
jgi:hypothetical protein